EDVITPIIGMIGGFDFSSFVITVNNSNIAIGNFINAVINFLLIAFVLFSIIKAMNKAAAVVKKPEEEPAAPTTKICPYCKSEIAIEATRCPHCTSQLEG
ncbi:MAG TPA: large conductance mechanosensitive channel protein MscL, partial [Lachnospiraceae bacterium]|nr:large conductance mechanosensitive channel protein MscL [Lachnospiraceae bacterium]